MINKIEFSAKKLTSKAGLFLLPQHANKKSFQMSEFVKKITKLM